MKVSKLVSTCVVLAVCSFLQAGNKIGDLRGIHAPVTALSSAESDVTTHGKTRFAVYFNWADQQRDKNKAPDFSNVQVNLDQALRGGVPITAIIGGTPDWAFDEPCVNPATVTTTSTDSCTGEVKTTKKIIDDYLNLRNNNCPYRPDFPTRAAYLNYVAAVVNSSANIDSFIIGNETNERGYFNACPETGKGCATVNDHVKRYTSYYFNPAYDEIKSLRPGAKVLVSLTGTFNVPGKINFDIGNPPSSLFPYGTPGNGTEYSIQKFLSVFKGYSRKTVKDPKTGKTSFLDRDWKLAIHPYGSGVFLDGTPGMDYTREGKAFNDFTVDDSRLTFGNLGLLSGYLSDPKNGIPKASQEIYLTESTFLRTKYLSEDDQAKWLCRSYAAVIGTPTVQQYLYYGYVDNTAEGHISDIHNYCVPGYTDRNGKYVKPHWSNPDGFYAFGTGLVGAGALDFVAESNGHHRKSYDVFRKVNSWSTYSCGFEVLTQNDGNPEPYYMVGLKRGYNHSSGKHYATSALFPRGFSPEMAWNILRAPVSTLKTHPIYQCQAGDSNFVSRGADCEGQTPWGILGYAFDDAKQAAGSAEIRRCFQPQLNDHLIQPGKCPAGWNDEGILGYGQFNNYYGTYSTEH